MLNGTETPTFWISGNTPSSKNGRVWTGNNFLPSAYTRVWIRRTKPEWIAQKEKFLEAIRDIGKPYYIELTFVRKSRHRFDYINIAQIICDMMKEHGWITDDNADEMKPYFADYIYDKGNPGVIIKIIKEKPKHFNNDIPTHY